MATIKDIAARSGVSIATVSKHINGIPVKEANRLRIDAAIQELGYQVNAAARTLKTRRSMTIGILLDRLSNLFYTSVIASAEELLLRQGYTAFLFETKDSLDQAQRGLGLFASKAVDGVLYLSSHCSAQIVRQCREGGSPIVLVDSIAQGLPDVDCIVTENARGAFEAVEFLLGRNCREIAVITGSSLHFSANERLRGYRTALGQAGLPLREEWVLRDEYNIDGGYRCVQRLLSLKRRPKALLICNYFMAVGAVMALNEANVRVPEEISIISFDEIELVKAIKPRLTTVNQQTERIAAQAVDCLLSRIGGDEGPGRVHLVPTILVERDSTAQLRPPFTIRALSAGDVQPDLLETFVRRRPITQKWVKAQGEWQLAAGDSVREWDAEKRVFLAGYLKEQLERGGFLACAYAGEQLIGFACVDGLLAGSAARYANLTMLFVDSRWQGRGVGRALFSQAAGYARALGADRLFISAVPSVETVAFYFHMGCRDAEEIIEGFVDTEEDRYLELPLPLKTENEVNTPC